MVSEQFSNWNNVARENGRKFVIDIICEAPWEQNVHIGWCFFFFVRFPSKTKLEYKSMGHDFGKARHVGFSCGQ